MFTLMKSSSQRLRTLADQARPGPIEKVGVGMTQDGRIVRYDAIFNAPERRSDKDVLAAVLAQL